MTEAKDRAKEDVISLSLGPVVHFGAILLVDEDDSDILGLGEEQGIRVGYDAFGAVAEDEGSEFGAFGAARSRGLHKLTRAHGEEISPMMRSMECS